MVLSGGRGGKRVAAKLDAALVDLTVYRFTKGLRMMEAYRGHGNIYGPRSGVDCRDGHTVL